MTKSQISEPKSKTKTQILIGLIEIYDSWKKEIDKLEEDYYLNIWHFEPRFANSQVACAIGDYLDFYENTFFKPDYSKKLIPENYGHLKNDVANIKWEYRLDEDHFDKNEPGDPELYKTLADYEEHKRWFEKKLKKPNRTTKFKEPIGEATESYSFKKGVIWLGEK